MVLLVSCMVCCVVLVAAALLEAVVVGGAVELLRTVVGAGVGLVCAGTLAAGVAALSGGGWRPATRPFCRRVVALTGAAVLVVVASVVVVVVGGVAVVAVSPPLPTGDRRCPTATVAGGVIVGGARVNPLAVVPSELAGRPLPLCLCSGSSGASLLAGNPCSSAAGRSEGASETGAWACLPAGRVAGWILCGGAADEPEAVAVLPPGADCCCARAAGAGWRLVDVPLYPRPDSGKNCRADWPSLGCCCCAWIGWLFDCLLGAGFAGTLFWIAFTFCWRCEEKGPLLTDAGRVCLGLSATASSTPSSELLAS